MIIAHIIIGRKKIFAAAERSKYNIANTWSLDAKNSSVRHVQLRCARALALTVGMQ